MAQRKYKPMIDDNGNVRDLTDEEYRWGVRDIDFGGNIGAVEFLTRRTAILREAEAQGFDRTLFLAFEPNKPGFEARALAAIAAFKNSGLRAAE